MFAESSASDLFRKCMGNETDVLLLTSGKELFILFAASAFRKLSSIYVFSYFPFGFEGRIWDLIVSVPDHCLSFYFPRSQKQHISFISHAFSKQIRSTTFCKHGWFLGLQKLCRLTRN